jgi:pSer/pThr/pTyr-binding forkhead associated (FHA) protein
MFDIAELSLEVIILLLRIAVVFLLYFFLWQVLRVVVRDLRSGVAPAPTQASPFGQLVITSSGLPGITVGKTFPLVPETTIGRSTECEIALNDTFLSAEHARLKLNGDGWTLEDLHSTNGTFINGYEVRSSTEVNEGDLIRIGRVEMKFVRA